jgi:hypothetical protein
LPVSGDFFFNHLVDEKNAMPAFSTTKKGYLCPKAPA